MNTQKKFIFSIVALLALCTLSAGCAFSFLPLSTDPATTTTVVLTTEPPAPATSPTNAPTQTPTTSPCLTTTTVPAPTVAVKSSIIAVDKLIGKSGADVRRRLGKPVATEKSEYGFDWHVYHKNYTDFVMIGIQNDKVVGLYSNSPSVKVESLTLGTTRHAVKNKLRGRYGEPLQFILKGDTNYEVSMPEQTDVFSDGEKYVTTFYDNIAGKKLVAIQIINTATELSYRDWPTSDKGFTDSYERISFYLINSTRVNFNKPILQYDKNMAKIAAAHSQDMIDRSFFDHINPSGKTHGNRIEAAGYQYATCAENIAKDCPGAAFAHQAYMNSPGHRENILRDIDYVGIGVRVGKGSILQTELFISYS